jgi:two-component system, response regulator
LVATLLLADDDPDDRLLVKDALEETRWTADLRSVEDGVELMDYLRHRGRYADPSEAPPPSLILLDLKMPRKSGHQALKEIKEDPDLRQIPVVILTTSRQEQDISRSYRLGVNSFITKPSSFGALVETMRVLERYWFEIVTLPGEHA